VRLCRDCLAAYRRKNKKATKPWPSSVYHGGEGRCCARHSGQRLKDCATSRAKRLRRYVSWADQDAIAAIYAEAARRRARGENVHVDHIFPLCGRLVSGLHVPENLQIIPARENIAKSNKFAPSLAGVTGRCDGSKVATGSGRG
jgi:hypothetical protein